jgi:hypothetical protein
VGHVARKGEVNNAYIIIFGKQEKRSLERPRYIYVSLILKWNLKKWCVRRWSGFI